MESRYGSKTSHPHSLGKRFSWLEESRNHRAVHWPKGAKEHYHCYLAHFHREPSKALCLELSRSWLLRSTGRCPYCRSTFPEKINDST